jgi:hypothetical protein
MNKNKLKFYLLLNLSLLSLFAGLVGTAVAAEEEDNKDLEDRQERDLDQTKKEADKLAKMLKEDAKACKAKSGGYTLPTDGVGGGNGQGRPSNDDPVQKPEEGAGSYGEPTASEQENRDALQAAGIDINKEPCNGRDYRKVPGGCTDVGGLPQHSVDRLTEINNEIGGGLMVTGGSEAGHGSHKPGNNVVDLRLGPDIDNYVAQNTVSTWSGGELGTYHQLSNGDVFLRESDHWHARLQGTVGSGTTAFNDKIRKIFGFNIKTIKKIFPGISLNKKVYAQAIDLRRIIDLGGTEFNLDTATTEQISSTINSLTPEQIRISFSQMSPNNLQEVVSTLPFDSLNNVFANLDSQSLDSIIPNLGADGLEGVISNFSYESVENVMGNLSSGNFNQLLGDLSDQGLNQLFTTVYNQAVFNQVIGDLPGDLLNDVVGQLGDGAINNIFGSLGDDVLNDVLGNLGMSEINDVFSQLGGNVLNDVLGGMTGDMAETVFSVIGDGAFGNILNNALPEVLDGVLSVLPEELLGDLFSELSISGLLGQFTDVLGEMPIVSDILGNIPGLGDLFGGFGIGNIIPGLGGLYVPVVEQNGQLMKLTKNTDKTIMEVKELNIQICTHLKAIHRIQAQMELKNVEDAKTMRIRATEIAKYRESVFGDNGAINKGYKTLDSEGNEISSPLFVTNQENYWEQNELEGKEIAIDKIKNSGNPYAEEILNALDTSNPFSLYSTINEEDITNLTGSEPIAKNTSGAETNLAQRKIPIISSLVKPFYKLAVWLTGNKKVFAVDPPDEELTKSSDYWSSWLKLIEPNNNRLGTFAIAMDTISREKGLALAAAQADADQGQGFLPIRECIKKTADGKTCLAWETIQPGSIAQKIQADAITSPLRLYEQADEVGEVAKGNEPNIYEFLENRPIISGGGAVGPGMIPASQIPNSIDDMISDVSTNQGIDTGETDTPVDAEDISDLDLGNLTDLIGNLFGGDDNPDLAGNSDLLAIINLIKQIVGPLWDNLRPIVTFGSKARESGEKLIYWYSPNATDCKADNDWPSDTATDGIAKKLGASLGTEGSLRVTPTTTTEYMIKCTKGSNKEKTKSIELNP